MSGYWPEGDLGDDCDGDIAGYDGPAQSSTTVRNPHEEGCLCAKCRGDRWNRGEIV